MRRLTAPPRRHAQVGIFQVMLLGRSAAVAYAVVRGMEPFLAFRDASSGAPCFMLRVQHLLAVGAPQDEFQKSGRMQLGCPAFLQHVLVRATGFAHEQLGNFDPCVCAFSSNCVAHVHVIDYACGTETSACL